MTIALDRPITDRDLRNFGIVFGAVLAGLFGLLLPYLFDHALPLWPWPVLVCFWLLALLRPSLLNGFYRLWMKVGSFVGMVNTRIILLVVFLVLIVPVGLLKRLVSGDTLHRRPDASLRSYRSAGRQPVTDNLDKPY